MSPMYVAVAYSIQFTTSTFEQKQMIVHEKHPTSMRLFTRIVFSPIFSVCQKCFRTHNFLAHNL